MFHLVHISDIHLTPSPSPSLLQLCSKRVTGWLNWKLNRTHKLDNMVLKNLLTDMQRQHRDHLVISGDLVNLSLPQEFVQARKWVEKLGSTRDVSVIFGNHDAYVPGALQQACQTFLPWIEGDISQEKDSLLFPYCRIRGHVAIIGVNSAQATGPFSARGIFDKKQASQLAEMLALLKQKGLFRIIALHHPPIPNAVSCHKALKGMTLFQQIITEKGTELILHGHSHRPTLHFIRAGNNQIPVVGVASASQGLDEHKSAAGYNIFAIKKSKEAWHCTLIRRTLIDRHGRFEETMRQELKF